MTLTDLDKQNLEILFDQMLEQGKTSGLLSMPQWEEGTLRAVKTYTITLHQDIDIIT